MFQTRGYWTFIDHRFGRGAGIDLHQALQSRLTRTRHHRDERRAGEVFGLAPLSGCSAIAHHELRQMAMAYAAYFVAEP